MFLLITGFCIGSFLGALTYRYPKNVSILKGRSWCDKCGKGISWYDNIPILSFLLLRGRCRNCGKKISARYLIIELMTGIGFLIIGPNIYGLILFCLLFAILIIDFEHQIIPDGFVFFGITIISLIHFIKDYSLFSLFLPGFIAASFLLFVFLITRGRGMGLGDVKFAVLGGLITGLNFFSLWLFLAFLTGAGFGIILILMKKAGLKDKVAFGPFLVAAVPITLIWGDKILSLMGL